MVKFLRKILYSVIVYILCITTVQGQLKEGMEYYRQRKYALAQQNLTEWYKANVNTNNVSALTALADCYWINRNYKKAFIVYQNLFTKSAITHNSEILKRIADIQAMRGDYVSASETLTGIERFNKKRNGFENYASFIKDSGNWNLNYLELNSLYTECMPYVFNNTFIVTADRELTTENYRSNNNFMKLQYVKSGNPKTTGFLSYEDKHGSFDKFNDLNEVLYRKKLAFLHENADVPLLNKYNYSPNSNPPDIDPNAQKLVNVSVEVKPKFRFNVGDISMQSVDSGKTIAYFVANDNGNNSMRGYNKNDSFEVPICLYKGIVKQENNSFSISNAVKMGIEGFDGELMNATVSRDGKLLVFSGKPVSGKTGYDLYYATRISENKWGDVNELGRNVNTYGDEVFPRLQDDGTLFFSSDGLPGLGALDVFCIPSFYNNGEVNKHRDPVHLSYPLNTAFDDYGVFITRRPDDEKYENLNKLEGYFTSNRIGTDDIFYFNYNRKVVTYRGIVYGKMPQGGSKQLPDVSVKLYADNNEIDKATTKVYGDYSFSVEPGHTYSLKAEKEGWTSSGADIASVLPVNADFPNIFLDSVVSKTITSNVDNPVPDNNENLPFIGKDEKMIKVWVIHHEFDETNIVAEDKNVIDSIVEFYKSATNATAKIFSTADCFGSVKYNDKLAKKRSMYIKNKLLKEGVTRIVDVNSAGMGKRIVPCPESEKLNAANKRKQKANRYTQIFITIKKQ